MNPNDLTGYNCFNETGSEPEPKLTGSDVRAGTEVDHVTGNGSRDSCPLIT